jgi:hypothetical protein
MITKRRLIELSVLAMAIFAIFFLAVLAYVEVVVRHTRFPVEARLLSAEGKIVFVPFNQRADDQKSPEDVAASSAVLARSGLWIKRLVMAGDKEYAFCPFGRVIILRGDGLDALEVESSTVWHGEPHDYPYPGRKQSNDGA